MLSSRCECHGTSEMTIIKGWPVCGTLTDPCWLMTMSAENRSKFAALHRQWWSLQICEIFSGATKKTTTTNKQMNNFKWIFFTVLLHTCYTYMVYFFLKLWFRLWHKECVSACPKNIIPTGDRVIHTAVSVRIHQGNKSNLQEPFS